MIVLARNNLKKDNYEKEILEMIVLKKEELENYTSEK